MLCLPSFTIGKTSVVLTAWVPAQKPPADFLRSFSLASWARRSMMRLSFAFPSSYQFAILFALPHFARSTEGASCLGLSPEWCCPGLEAAAAHFPASQHKSFAILPPHPIASHPTPPTVPRPAPSQQSCHGPPSLPPHRS